MFASLRRARVLPRLALGAGTIAAGGAVTSSTLASCAMLDAEIEMNTVPFTQPQALVLGSWQNVSNWVYEHPFKTIISIVVPSYGLLFANESLSEATKGMLLSQKLIHTRVFGQAIAVVTTVSVMAYVKHMELDGGIYRIAPDGKSVDRGYQTEGLRHWYSVDKASGQTLQDKLEQEGATNVSHDIDVPSLFVPLLWIPFISAINLGLRGRVAPDRVTQLTLAAIGVGLAHAASYQFTDSSMGFDRK